MYEQHFELTDRPFGSTPDPAFYFDSRGHRRALDYLRYATREGDSLILLTGDIGTGKTTLVCKLLGELDPKAVVSAHLVSTQLNALDLLMALTRALGGSLSGRSRDESRAALQSFLATLTATGRKALVVIDEAQNLLPDALAEITDLARPQLGGSNAPLQIMLVGHPELGRRLPVGEAQGARRLIFLACHLGPLVAAETRAYIEHRLRRVQWHGSPSFSSAAFLRIHQATEGVPRRINRLCDRLLLAACLHDLPSVSAELVAQTDAELNAELDGLVPAFDAPAIDAPPHVASPACGRPAVAEAGGARPRAHPAADAPANAAARERLGHAAGRRRIHPHPRFRGGGHAAARRRAARRRGGAGSARRAGGSDASVTRAARRAASARPCRRGRRFLAQTGGGDGHACGRFAARARRLPERTLRRSSDGA